MGAVMSAVHFNAEIMTITEVQSNAAIMSSFHYMFGIVPGALYASCALFLIFYNLDNRTMAQMKQELDESRKTEE